MLAKLLFLLFFFGGLATVAWFIAPDAEAQSPLPRAAVIALTRNPSLQQCAADSAVISWKTDLRGSSVVQYSLDQSYNLEARDISRVIFHVVTLRGLQSDRKYNYRIVAEGETLYTSAFRTYPRPGDARYHHFSFWGMGDSGSGDSNQVAIRDQIQKLVEEGEADFGIHLGDIVYPQGEEQDQDSKYFAPYQSIIDKQVCWPVLGNHDKSTKNGQPYFDNRVLPEPDTLAFADNPERWYAFTYGSALFIALDSDNPSNSTQTKFLRLALERHREKLWKFVFFHHPSYATAYADTAECSHASDREARNRWSPLFEEFEVDVVFTAHNHTYQRSLRRQDYYTDRQGVYYIVTGGGGAEIAAVDSFDARCNNPPLLQAFVKSNTHHLIHVRIDSLTFSMRALDKAGHVFDAFEIRKGTVTNGDEEPEVTMPRALTLRQNYPNPLIGDNRSVATGTKNTAIEFSLPGKERVSLIIFDALGREVCRMVDEELTAGVHVRYWDGRDELGAPVSPGIYFYRLATGNQIVNRRMLLLE